MISDPKICFYLNIFYFRELVNDCANQKTSSSPAFEQKMNGNNTPKIARTQTKTTRHSCSMCSKLFSNSRNLKRHVRTHTGENPYICSLCSKSFTESRSLKSHIQIHTGEQLFICSLCSKSFSNSSNLKSHMRVHTGEKPYICSLCSKSFTKSSNLKSHTRIHTGEKPYSCSLCNEPFFRYRDLNNHMRTHRWDKPYIYLISELNSPKSHMWIYTGVTLYNCCFHNLKMLSLEIILLITWKRYWNLNTVFSRLTPEKKNLTVVPFVINLSPCKGCQSSIYCMYIRKKHTCCLCSKQGFNWEIFILEPIQEKNLKVCSVCNKSFT